MMKNPRVMFAVIGGLSTGVIIAVVLFFTILKTDSTESITGNTSEQTEPTPTPILPSATKEPFSDESGFTFSYPADVVVDQQDLAKSDYAHLSLTSTRAEGSLRILASDTAVTSIDAWLLENLPEASESGMTTVKFGDLEAQEITIEKGITTIALDRGVIFTIDTTSDTHLDYWEKVYRIVLESFAFAVPESAPVAEAPAADGSGGITFEGEEIVE